MISRLRGAPAGRTVDGLVLDVGGVGYLVAATPSAIARCRSAAGALETTARATFGPIPLTPRRWTKSARSATSAKP